MEYIVKSRGRPIGTTELDFMRIGGPSRSGHFHPNGEGERVMAEIASPLPAMRAYLHREYVDENGERVVRPELIGSQLFAEMAEAFRRTEELELTLHRDDGSLVPTTSIGFQDTESLRSIGELQLADEPPPELDPELDEQLRREIEHDTAIIEEMFADEITGDDLAAARDDEWMEDFEFPTFPRYQIHVELADDSAIP